MCVGMQRALISNRVLGRNVIVGLTIITESLTIMSFRPTSRNLRMRSRSKSGMTCRFKTLLDESSSG